MNIINEISELKNNYKNNDNSYEIYILKQDNGEIINEQYFQEKLRKIIKYNWDDVKIIDNKKYIKNDLILSINTLGEIKCRKRIMLKYKNLDKFRINLYNERKINSDNFYTDIHYDKTYKQKKIVFSLNGFMIILTIKINEQKKEKITTFEIKIVFKSKEDEKYLKEILGIIFN